jgi:DNA repair protein RadC
VPEGFDHIDFEMDYKTLREESNRWNEHFFETEPESQAYHLQQIIPLASWHCLPFPVRMKPGRTLLESGAERCSDAELLAILLGSGGRGYSALDSANALLDKYGTLAGLMNRPLDEIAQVRGIKVVRAIRLAAAYEICQRLLKEIARDR